jgi:hypothetical protein
MMAFLDAILSSDMRLHISTGTAEPKGSVADYLLHHMTVTITVAVTNNTTSKREENREIEI